MNATRLLSRAPGPPAAGPPTGRPGRPGHRASAVTRSRRVLPATLTASALLAVAVVVGVSAVRTLLGAPAWLPFGALGELGAGLTAASPPVLAGAAAVAVLGLLLLLAAVLPGPPRVLPLRADGDLDAGVTRRSLAAALTAAARAVDGVDRASVRVGARSVTATVRGHRTPELGDRVRAALVERLVGIGLARLPRVRVGTRST